MLYSKTKIALQGRGRIHTRSSRREGAWNGRPLWIWRRPIRWPIPFSLWTFDLCYAVSSPSFCCFVELTNQRWYQNLGFFFRQSIFEEFSKSISRKLILLLSFSPSLPPKKGRGNWRVRDVNAQMFERFVTVSSPTSTLNRREMHGTSDWVRGSPYRLPLD